MNRRKFFGTAALGSLLASTLGWGGKKSSSVISAPAKIAYKPLPPVAGIAKGRLVFWKEVEDHGPTRYTDDGKGYMWVQLKGRAEPAEVQVRGYATIGGSNG